MGIKPCRNCWHKKGGHAYNPTLVPGGEWNPTTISYPCQEKGCKCNNYQEATYEEKEQRRRDKIWALWKGEKK
jgi:hypothetical protein